MKWFNLIEACEYISTSEKRMRNLIKSGQISAKVDGRLFKISDQELDRYMDSLPTAMELEESKVY